MADRADIAGAEPAGTTASPAAPAARSVRPRRLRQLLRYFTVARWLLGDSLWRFKWPAGVALACGALSVALQAGVLGMVVSYARHLEKGQPLSLAGHAVDPRSSQPLLLGIASIGFVALILSAGLLYFSQRRIYRLGRRYQDFCAQRIISLLHRSSVAWLPTRHHLFPETRLRKYIRADARYCGRILIILLGTFTPVWMVLAGMILLANISATLTLIIAIILLLSAGPYYVVSVRGANHSRAMERHGPDASAQLKDVLDRARLHAQPRQDADAPLERGAFKLYLDAYEGRLRTIINSRFVSTLLLAIVLCLIVVVIGRQTLAHAYGWSTLLAYVVALQYTLTGVNQATRRITSINRFYPYFKDYATFIEATERDAKAADGAGTPRVTDAKVRVRTKDALPLSERSWSPDGPCRVALISPLPVDRALAASVLHALYRDRMDQGVPPATVLFATDATGIAAAWAEPSPWLLVEASDLRSLDPRPEGDRALVIRYDAEDETVGGLGERIAVAHDGVNVVGVGDLAWLHEVQEPLRRRFAPIAAKRKRAAIDEEDDDIEDG